MHKFGPLTAEYPHLGEACPICKVPFVVGDYTALLPMDVDSPPGGPKELIQLTVVHHDCGELILDMNDEPETSFLEIKRPDGWAASIERLLFGRVKLKFYEPQNDGVAFCSLEGPATALGMFGELATKVLLGNNPAPIESLPALSADTLVFSLFSTYEPHDEQGDDGFYRFSIDGELYRASPYRKK